MDNGSHMKARRPVLIGLLLVFLVVGLVIVFAIRDVRSYTMQFPIHVANTSIQALVLELRSYCNGHPDSPYPSSLDQVRIKDPRWKIDPWGTPFRYQLLTNGCVLSSAGPDRQFGTADDIVRRLTWDEIQGLNEQNGNTNGVLKSPP